MTGHQPFSPEAWGDRLAERGPSPRPAPAGERLEPVEPGQMRPGDELRIKLRERRGVFIAAGAAGIRVDLGDGRPTLIDPDEYTFERVVKDPPLPTTPGTVIDAVVDTGGGPVSVRLMRRARDGHELADAWLWVADRQLSDGLAQRFSCHDRHIRPGWRQVYPEPGGEH